MNLVTAGRMHPVEQSFQYMALALPAMLFGEQAVAPTLAFTVARAAHSLAVHSGFDWKWG
jgi:sterol desaturase/sphingolipid hydroxylase (fatty acid hydroxylase superfamily)